MICDDAVALLCAYVYTLFREPGGENTITPSNIMQSTALNLSLSSSCFLAEDCPDKCVADFSMDQLQISCCCNEPGASCSDAVGSVAVAEVSLTGI